MLYCVCCTLPFLLSYTHPDVDFNCYRYLCRGEDMLMTGPFLIMPSNTVIRKGGDLESRSYVWKVLSLGLKRFHDFCYKSKKLRNWQFSGNIQPTYSNLETESRKQPIAAIFGNTHPVWWELDKCQPRQDSVTTVWVPCSELFVNFRLVVLEKCGSCHMAQDYIKLDLHGIKDHCWVQSHCTWWVFQATGSLGCPIGLA